jgi:hypothetical protein
MSAIALPFTEAASLLAGSDGLVNAGIRSFSSSGAGGLFSGGGRAWGSLGNSVEPNVLPPPPMLMQLLWQKRVDPADILRTMRFHAIDLSQNGHGGWWYQATQASKPPLPLELINRLWANRAPTEEPLFDHYNRAGIFDLEAKKLLELSIGAPGWEYAIAQRRLGQISDADWSKLLKVYGKSDRSWLSLSTLATAPLGSAMALELWTRGLLTDVRAEQHVSASGILANPDYSAVFELARWAKLPALQIILQMFRLGIISQQDYTTFAARAGYKDDVIRGVFEKQSSPLPSGAVFDLWNRGVINDATANSHLRSAGFVTDTDRFALASLRFNNPTVTSTIRYVVNAVANQTANRLLGLDLEKPQAVDDASAANGYNQPTITVQVPNGNPFTLSPGDGEWLSHWRIPSVTEAAIVKRQLTPGRIAALKAVGVDVEPVTQEQVDAIGVASNTPPNWRAYEQSRTWEVVPIRYAGLARTQGTITHQQFLDSLSQMGYLPNDARAIADAYAQRQFDKDHPWLARVTNQYVTRGINAIIQGFQEGHVTRQQAIQRLNTYEFGEGEASTILDVAAQEVANKAISVAITATHKAFLTGEFAVPQIAGHLAQIGIVEPMITHYIALWQLDMTVSQRHLATKEIQALAENGIITNAVAQQRLINLGWSQPDLVLLMSEIALKEKQIKAKAQSADTKARQAKAKALQEAHKQATQMAAQSLKALKAVAPLSKLVAWYKNGVIDRETLVSVLRQQGYTEQVIYDTVNTALRTLTAKQQVYHGQDVQSAEAAPAGVERVATAEPTTGS